jgi:hypothetical protein
MASITAVRDAETVGVAVLGHRVPVVSPLLLTNQDHPVPGGHTVTLRSFDASGPVLTRRERRAFIRLARELGQADSRFDLPASAALPAYSGVGQPAILAAGLFIMVIGAFTAHLPVVIVGISLCVLVLARGVVDSMGCSRDDGKL